MCVGRRSSCMVYWQARQNRRPEETEHAAMESVFEKLGRKTGRALMKGRCLYDALAGTESEAIQAEYLLGQDLAKHLGEKLKPASDPTLGQLTQAVGEKLKARLTDKRRLFTFEVFESPEPNAFALPGGFVFVTDSILERCGRDQAETAFVLSHEMAHVVCRHCMERMLANTLFSTLSRTLSPRNAAATWLRQVGVKFLTSAYSRDNELEADEFAVLLARAAGFDPQAGARLLARLAKRPAARPLAAYFGSHPPLEERIRDVLHHAATR